ncbi:hypothetical protein PS647_04787 [Pseudomonas fluorescens]|nr:hypothetical protein PS647_04787 [Pseudomonas fluorescens]
MKISKSLIAAFRIDCISHKFSGRWAVCYSHIQEPWNTDCYVYPHNKQRSYNESKRITYSTSVRDCKWLRYVRHTKPDIT